MVDSFYHVSLEERENHFISRVPQFRLFEEEKETGRICVSNSLKGSLAAFPDNYRLGLSIPSLRMGLSFYLYVFEIPQSFIPASNIIVPEKLKNCYGVVDSLLTQEYWVINQELKFTNEYMIYFEHIEINERFSEEKPICSVTYPTKIHYQKSVEPFERDFIFPYWEEVDIEVLLEHTNQDWIVDKKKVNVPESHVTYRELHLHVPAFQDMREVWLKYANLKLMYNTLGLWKNLRSLRKEYASFVYTEE